MDTTYQRDRTTHDRISDHSELNFVIYALCFLVALLVANIYG